MARAVSTPSSLTFKDRDIMRAIYYHQQLTRELMALGTSHLNRRLQTLEMVGYVRKSEGRFVLTDTGILVLRRMYGGRKPPMIDTRRDVKLDEKDKSKQFRVGSSLARTIAREVSIGE